MVEIEAAVRLAADFALLLSISACIVLFADLLRRVHAAPREFVLARLFVGPDANVPAWYLAVAGMIFLIASFLAHAIAGLFYPGLITEAAFDVAYGVLGTGGFALLAMSIRRFSRRLSARISPMATRKVPVRTGGQTRR